MVTSLQSKLQDLDVEPNPKISISILAAGLTVRSRTEKIKDFDGDRPFMQKNRRLRRAERGARGARGGRRHSLNMGVLLTGRTTDTGHGPSRRGAVTCVLRASPQLPHVVLLGPLEPSLARRVTHGPHTAHSGRFYQAQYLMIFCAVSGSKDKASDKQQGSAISLLPSLYAALIN